MESAHIGVVKSVGDIMEPSSPAYTAIRGSSRHAVRTTAYVLKTGSEQMFVYLRTEELRLSDEGADGTEFQLLCERSLRCPLLPAAGLKGAYPWAQFREIIRLAEHDCAENGPRDLE